MSPKKDGFFLENYSEYKSNDEIELITQQSDSPRFSYPIKINSLPPQNRNSRFLTSS